MNAKRLLAHYATIADAPGAIARLRGFILDLAVRGKLVSQDASDESASELVKRIGREKARLVKAGEIRKLKASELIREDELPIELPRNWAWVRLREIGNLSGGTTPSMNRSDFWDGDIVWLSPKDIKSDEVADSELKISALGLAETRLELYRPGCLFMVARSGILKRTFPVSINRVPAAANQDMKVLAPFLEGQERYLQMMFRGLTDFLLREMVKTGTTVQSLKYAEFEQQPFPLPPLAEQRRIVAKVDELMGLCDRLEAARASREATRDRLAAASLARLNAPDPETFHANARFALDALPALTTRPDQIKALRQSIFNLAVRGKLVPHDTMTNRRGNC
jgi:type I restriction enzyme, S subunit